MTPPDTQGEGVKLNKKDWLRAILQAGILIFVNFVGANLILATSNVTYTYGEREVLQAALLAATTITFALFFSNAILLKRIERIERQLRIKGNKI